MAGWREGRAAGLVSAMAARFSVRVLAPMDGAVPDGIVVAALPDEEPAARLVSLLSPPAPGGTGPARPPADPGPAPGHRRPPAPGGAVRGRAPGGRVPHHRPADLRRLPDAGGAGDRGWRRSRPAGGRRWRPARAVAVSAASADDVDLLTSWGARAAVLVADGSAPAAWGPLADAVAQGRGGLGRIVSPTSSRRLTDAGVRRARLRGQWLSGRVPAGRSVDDVVGAAGGRAGPGRHRRRRSPSGPAAGGWWRPTSTPPARTGGSCSRGACGAPATSTGRRTSGGCWRSSADLPAAVEAGRAAGDRGRGRRPGGAGPRRRPGRRGSPHPRRR